VVVVPQDRIVAVASAAERQRAKENDIESRLRAGQTVLQVLGLSR
jgi:regulator of RNase E activity RraA